MGMPMPREVWLAVSTIIDTDDEEAERRKVAEILGPDYLVLTGTP